MFDSFQVAQITAVSDDLPAIILRLKTLETLHHEAASFNVRLAEASESITRLSCEVDSNTETLASLKMVHPPPNASHVSVGFRGKYRDHPEESLRAQ